MEKQPVFLVFILATLLVLFPAASWLGALVPAGQESRDDNKTEPVRPAGEESFADWDQLRVLGHGTTMSLAYSPDGRRLAIAGAAGVLEIRNTTTWEIERQMNEAPKAFSVRWSPDGRRLVTGADNWTAKIWDARTGRILHTLRGHTQSVNSVDWSPDGRRIVSGSTDRSIKIWEASTGKLLRTISGLELGVIWVRWSPDATRIAAAVNGKVPIWDAQSGERIHTLQDPFHTAYSLSWSPDGTRLASSSEWSAHPEIKVWDAKTGHLIWTLSGPRSETRSVDWSPDGKKIAAAGTDQAVEIWDADTGQLIKDINLGEYAYLLHPVVWSPDSKQLAYGTALVRILDAETGEVLESFSGSRGDGRSLRWSPDGSRVASSISISDPDSDRVLRFTGYTGQIYSSAWSPDGGRLIFSGSGSGISSGIRMWDTKTGELLLTIETNAVASVSWSPDGSRIANSGGLFRDDNRRIEIREAETGDLIQTIPTEAAALVRWSPDGKRLASGGRAVLDGYWRGFLEIREAETGHLLMTMLDDLRVQSIASLAWSPDGKRLASGPWRNGWPAPDIRIWEAETGQRLRTIASPSVYSLSWSPDGRYLAQSTGGDVRIWNAETGQLLRTLTGHVRQINAADWSPDGTRIASGAEDGSIRIWGSRADAANDKVSLDPSRPDLESLRSNQDEQKLNFSSSTKTNSWLKRFLNFISSKSRGRH